MMCIIMLPDMFVTVKASLPITIKYLIEMKEVLIGLRGLLL